MEFSKRGIGRLNGLQIQFGLECKMVEFGGAFEQFEFDITAQRSKEMISLRGDGLRG